MTSARSAALAPATTRMPPLCHPCCYLLGARPNPACVAMPMPSWCLQVQIAKTVGGGKTAARCEALFLKHRGYLSLPRVHQSEVAWQAMVQDGLNSGAPTKVRPSVCRAGALRNRMHRYWSPDQQRCPRSCLLLATLAVPPYRLNSKSPLVAASREFELLPPLLRRRLSRRRRAAACKRPRQRAAARRPPRQLARAAALRARRGPPLPARRCEPQCRCLESQLLRHPTGSARPDFALSTAESGQRDRQPHLSFGWCT